MERDTADRSEASIRGQATPYGGPSARNNWELRSVDGEDPFQVISSRMHGSLGRNWPRTNLWASLESECIAIHIPAVRYTSVPRGRWTIAETYSDMTRFSRFSFPSSKALFGASSNHHAHMRTDPPEAEIKTKIHASTSSSSKPFLGAIPPGLRGHFPDAGRRPHESPMQSSAPIAHPRSPAGGRGRSGSSRRSRGSSSASGQAREQLLRGLREGPGVGASGCTAIPKVCVVRRKPCNMCVQGKQGNRHVPYVWTWCSATMQLWSRCVQGVWHSVSPYLCSNVCVYGVMQACTLVCVYVGFVVCVHVCMYMYVHVYLDMNMCMCRCIWDYMYTCLNSFIHVYM